MFLLVCQLKSTYWASWPQTRFKIHWMLVFTKLGCNLNALQAAVSCQLRKHGFDRSGSCWNGTSYLLKLLFLHVCSCLLAHTVIEQISLAWVTTFLDQVDSLSMYSCELIIKARWVLCYDWLAPVIKNFELSWLWLIWRFEFPLRRPFRRSKVSRWQRHNLGLAVS